MTTTNNQAMSITMIISIVIVMNNSMIITSAFLLPQEQKQNNNGPLQQQLHRPSSLHASWWDGDESYDAMEYNLRRTDIRSFLTQRSIQSFLQLCISCRDPHTVQWMENKFDWKSIEEYHGTGGINTTLYPHWSSVLLDLLDQPQDVVVVNVPNKNRKIANPYLEERVIQFEIDIDPASMANRILSVREQIAQEWTTDIDTMKNANEQILESYREAQLQNREDDNDGTDSERAAFQRYGVSYYLPDDGSSSPLRHRSFDLVLLLATQESIHRVLRMSKDSSMDNDDDDEMAFLWFRDYYIQRLPTYFDGNQELGRANDFVEELLLTPPLFYKNSLVDPFRIAEDLLEMRSEVLMEWKTMMPDVKDTDHAPIRSEVLIRQMLKWGSYNNNDGGGIIVSEMSINDTLLSSSCNNNNEVIGEFQ